MAATGIADGHGGLPHGRLIALALPITLSNLSTPLLGLVNAAVIGRLGDAALLGAVAVGAVIFDVLFWSFGFLRMGTAGLTAQANGAGDRVEERAALLRALTLALGIGAVFILTRGWIAQGAIALMQAGPDIQPALRDYFDVRIIAAPLTLVTYAILGSLTGRGKTGYALVISIIINVLNIILSLLFVTQYGFAVRGVAWASVLAEAGGVVAGLFILAGQGMFSGPSPRGGLFQLAAMRRMLAVNRDIFIRTLGLIAAIVFFTRQGVVTGTTVLAANAVLHNLFLTGSFFLDGFATAVEQMAGHAVGARNRDAFRKAVKTGLIWCMGFGVVASLLFWLFGGLVIDAITTSDAVRRVARDYLWLAALTPCIGAAAFLYDGVFIGATWSRAMRNTMLMALGGAALIFFVLRDFGNTGLWLSFLAMLGLRGLLQALVMPRLEQQTFSLPGPAHAAR
ncbi:MAG: MATE family efflux transporter [Beijerinckiaceae bacterium]